MLNIFYQEDFSGGPCKVFCVRSGFSSQWPDEYMTLTIQGVPIWHKFDSSSVMGIKPFLQLPFRMPEEFFKAMAITLDIKAIKTPNDDKMAGLLEAKDKHLEDMRKLVFKNQGINL